MVGARRGGSTLGCLVTLLIIGTAVYVGIALGRPWFRYEQFRDEMTSAARFSTTLTDAQILTRLRAVADTLGLPPDAKKIIVKRLDPSGGVVISVKYTERVTLPLYGEKVFKFAPKIVGGEP